MGGRSAGVKRKARAHCAKLSRAGEFQLEQERYIETLKQCAAFVDRVNSSRCSGGKWESRAVAGFPSAVEKPAWGAFPRCVFSTAAGSGFRFSVMAIPGLCDVPDGAAHRCA